MRRIEVVGSLYIAWVKAYGTEYRRVFEKSITESIGHFAHSVFEDLENEFPNWDSIAVSAYGDMEADLIVDCDKSFDEFFIATDD